MSLRCYFIFIIFIYKIEESRVLRTLIFTYLRLERDGGLACEKRRDRLRDSTIYLVANFKREKERERESKTESSPNVLQIANRSRVTLIWRRGIPRCRPVDKRGCARARVKAELFSVDKFISPSLPPPPPFLPFSRSSLATKTERRGRSRNTSASDAEKGDRRHLVNTKSVLIPPRERKMVAVFISAEHPLPAHALPSALRHHPPFPLYWRARKVVPRSVLYIKGKKKTKNTFARVLYGSYGAISNRKVFANYDLLTRRV